MFEGEPLEYGGIRGTMYTGDKGATLPLHVHPQGSHITIVARGRILVTGREWKIEVVAGQLVDFKPGQAHEIEALEDGTRIFNIQKGA